MSRKEKWETNMDNWQETNRVAAYSAGSDHLNVPGTFQTESQEERSVTRNLTDASPRFWHPSWERYWEKEPNQISSRRSKM